MNTGTISLAADSTTVTGTGTEFTSEVNAGDFIFTTVNGINFTLGVNSVDSDTSITLAANYSGATISGLGFSTVPQGAVIGITAQIAADTARAIRGLNYDKQNWQQILSGSGTVTVMLPDGSQYSGPAWKGIINSLANKANTNDVNNALDKKTNSTDLGKLSSLDSVSRSQLDSELFRNLFACGGTSPNNQGAGVYSFNNTPFGWNTQYGICAQFSNLTNSDAGAGESRWQHYLALGTNGDIIYVTNINGNYSARKLYSTTNTTTNSSGALVPASPIVRIVNSVAANTRQDVVGTSDEYTKQSDYGFTNDESEGCIISKIDTGEYLIAGAKSLATDLWQVMDCGNGQGRIIALAEATETNSGIKVQCYKQIYTLTDGELLVSKGDLIDIPDNTWIDVRLVMPDGNPPIVRGD